MAQVLERQLPKLQAELVRSVLAELPAPAAAPAASRESGAGSLVQAVASVHAGTTQKEILRALLDAGSAYGARVALFVVKAGAANGWQGRGFDDDDAIKDFALDMSGGPAAHAYPEPHRDPGQHCRDGSPVRDAVRRTGERTDPGAAPGPERQSCSPALCRWRRQQPAGRDLSRIAGDGHQHVAGSHLVAQAGAEGPQRGHRRHAGTEYASAACRPLRRRSQ